jgi:hypothetical protein
VGDSRLKKKEIKLLSYLEYLLQLFYALPMPPVIIVRKARVSGTMSGELMNRHGHGYEYKWIDPSRPTSRYHPATISLDRVSIIKN